MSGSQERDLIIKRGYLTGKGGFLVSNLRSLLCCALLASSLEVNLHPLEKTPRLSKLH